MFALSERGSGFGRTRMSVLSGKGKSTSVADSRDILVAADCNATLSGLGVWLRAGSQGVALG